MADEDEDELDFEEFSKLTEAQQEAVIAREFKELERVTALLTPQQLYEAWRRSRVTSCLRWRKLMRATPGLESWMREMLRERQKGLLKLRVWHATGQWPGEA